MSFTITRVVLKNFRNYREFEFFPGPELTIVLGPNAAGKTNLLEAIQLTTAAASFRRPSWGDVPRWGSTGGIVELEAADEDRERSVAVSIVEGKRQYSVNGKPRRSVQEVTGEIPCVIFTPDDLALVKESADRRREAVDTIGVQLSRTYGRLKAEYERVVRQRNRLLRQEAVDEDMLSVWDERLVHLGSRLCTHRRGLFDKIGPVMTQVYARIAEDGELRAEYLPSWERDGLATTESDITAALEQHLVLKRAEERSRSTTLVGPHRDDFVFFLADRDARAFASQGQQRSIALSFKLAEVSVVTEVSGSKPVLLLDDVMSELDENRREALSAVVGEEAQTVMTTTNAGYFSEELLSRAKVVKL